MKKELRKINSLLDYIEEYMEHAQHTFGSIGNGAIFYVIDVG